MDNKVDTFEYPYSVQVKIMTSIITDRDFTSQILDTFNFDFFDSKPLKWIGEKTLDYFKKHKYYFKKHKYYIKNMKNKFLKFNIK